MSFLVSNGALQRMEATPVKPDFENGKQSTRRQTYVPGDIVIPEMVKSIIDESYIEIGDEQTWDDSKPYKQHSLIRPTILGDVITTKALLKLEKDDDDRGCCWHTLSGSVSVSVLFLGYYVEQAVLTNMKSFYDNYPAHIDDFIDFVLMKFGDGTRRNLTTAIDRMLAEEKKALQ